MSFDKDSNEHSFLHSKTPACNHQLGCLTHAVKKFTKILGIGYGIKYGFAFLFFLVNPSKGWKKFSSGAQFVDSSRFAWFLACLNTAYKGSLCGMRRVSKNEKVNSIVAGLVAGLTLAIDDRQRRIEFGQVFLARALYILLIVMKK